MYLYMIKTVDFMLRIVYHNLKKVKDKVSVKIILGHWFARWLSALLSSFVIENRKLIILSLLGEGLQVAGDTKGPWWLVHFHLCCDNKEEVTEMTANNGIKKKLTERLNWSA